MTDQTDPHNGTPDTVQELTGLEDGVWNVITRGSVHRFDFTAGTVTRIPGPNSRPGINDLARPLMRIQACRVGARGYWTMRTDDWSELVDHYWHYSSTIARIERVIDASPPLATEPHPADED